MNLLEDGIKTQSVIKTENKKKLVIDNKSNEYDVYQIKLDFLYFNDKNDRISTWISEYNETENIEKLISSDRAKYNNIIHDFITESNITALKKTQKNIDLIGQQEVGVVLLDGRIIDGNRRFTCLRNIQEETGKTQYFEAVILSHDLEHNEKHIKLLELMLQHGVDEKVDYNPIDKLVGVYKDIVEQKLIDIKEYAQSTNKSENEIKQEVEKSKLLVEYLEFINAPMQFHLARTMNLDGPLTDLNKILEKIKNDDTKEDLKNNVYAQLLVQPIGDMTRYVRDIGKVAKNSRFATDFIDEQLSFTEAVCDMIEGYPKVNEDVINSIQNSDSIKEMREKFKHSTDKFKGRLDSETARNQPANLADKAYDQLDLIDINIFGKLTNQQKQDVSESLDMIEEKIAFIRNELNV